MKWYSITLVLLIIPINLVFAEETKSIYNYNLDDVAFQICKAEYDIYENTASMHIGDPHLLSQWKQYTQCHDDAFLVLHDTKHLCAEQIKKAKNTKIVNDSLEWYDRQMSESRMIHEFEKAIECHKQVYYEEIAKITIIETPEPTPKETSIQIPKEIPKQTPESKINCGKGTIDIDGICQVDKSEIKVKQNHKSWFSWIFDLF